jgi:tetratricopeptide (TPR) repeat protein
MASAALKAEVGTEIPGEGEQTEVVETGARDFEAEAREHGWVPEGEFKGDSSRWVDAETFMKRADEMMPLLKAQNARLKRDLDSLKKDLKRATAHFEGAEKRAYDRAKADLEQRIEEAVESGDLQAARAAMKDLGELKPTDTDAAPAKATKEEAQEALDDFREANPWYDRANLANASELDINARLYFDRMIDRHIDKTKDLAPAEFFGFIQGLTEERYPQLKAKPARQKPASAVEGGTSGRARGSSKSWDALPETARRQFEKFQARGILGVKATGDKDKDMAASRAYYARTFDWEGYQQ